MNIHLHLHLGDELVAALVEKLAHPIITQLEKIMQSQAQLAADLATVKDQVVKIGTETRTLLDKIDTLTAAVVNAGNTTPEVDTALADLKAQAQIVDDLVPDAAPTP